MMQKLATAATALVLSLAAASTAAGQASAPRMEGGGSDPRGTVVIDASRFLDEIQRSHVITDAASLGVAWLFNNTALQMRSRSNYVIPVEIPEAGTYHLYARSHGGERSQFRVAVGNRVIGANIANAPLRLERVGEFELPGGPVDVRLMQIDGDPVLDVLVLSRSAELREEDLLPFQLQPDVVLLREYSIPRSGAVKFGDLTGDGRMDFVVLTPGYSAHAYDHDGNRLWSYEAPAEGERARAEFEAPGVVWDLDGDGVAEVIHWRLEEGTEWLAVADGRTGRVKRRVPWPTRPLPHVYNNFRLAIGQLAPGYPSNVLVLTDMGGTISVAAYDAALNQLWNHVEQKQKDHLGHYVYPVDLTGDGIDEVAVGTLVLDAQGREIWNRFDLFYNNRDHVDSYRVADLNGDGQLELVAAHSEVGVVAYRALTGEILWQHTGEHAQQVEVGHFLAGAAGPQVALGARTYGNRQAGEPYLSAQVWWFDPAGTLLGRWPGMPLNGNPVFVKGDWRGNGVEELFWYKFRMNGEGRGELFFGEPVFHMFDFLGDAAEEVITLQGGVLRVYGYRHADHGAVPVKRSPDYLRQRVANHTHY